MPYPFNPGEAMPSSYVNNALLKGAKNRIINGAFQVNQRAYASAGNLVSGAYGFDRWKSGFTNTALTFTAGAQDTTVTISSSGVLQQVIERANVPAGTYVLSWTGTATGRVYNSGGTPPSYAASPVTVTLNGSANVVVEFTASGGTRTLGTVQLERGTVPSPFEYRMASEELALCQRYFYRVGQFVTGGSGNIIPFMHVALGTQRGVVYFPVSMRIYPSLEYFANWNVINNSVGVFNPGTIAIFNITNAGSIYSHAVITVSGGGVYSSMSEISIPQVNGAHVSFNAEL
jgi:hypothetical protein